MTYDEAVRFWFGRINYEQKLAQPGDFELHRIRALLDSLGNPQNRFRIVHLAGSKGKGSTSAILASVLLGPIVIGEQIFGVRGARERLMRSSS